MKTVCIYHSIDLDGWMSAAIVKHWWNLVEKSPNDKLHFNGGGGHRGSSGFKLSNEEFVAFMSQASKV